MQVSFKSQYVYNYPTNVKKSDSTIVTNQVSKGIELPNFEQSKPLISQIFSVINVESPEIKQLKKLVRGADGKFSLTKAASTIKSLVDNQMMPYSEDDIKNVVQNISAKNPQISREQILKTMAQLTSFSNYESLESVEKYCQKEKIAFVYNTDTLTVNNIFKYLSNSEKLILNLANPISTVAKTGLFLDRNTVKFLEKMKKENLEEFNSIKLAIRHGNIKLILLDGWEAKATDGNKSFNIIGAWGDLEKTVTSIIETEDKTKKSSFNDDIISSVNDLFEDDIPIDIIQNIPEQVDEKIIAERLNPKSITQESIEKNIKSLSQYVFNSKNLTSAEYNELRTRIEYPVDADDIEGDLKKYLGAKDLTEEQSTRLQELISLMMLYTTNVYSPRRIATEMVDLHKKLSDRTFYYDKTVDDLVFIVPQKNKSFGLVNYQYSKVNDISDERYIYHNKNNLYIDIPNKKNKVFVLFDDFSGSGTSLAWEQLPYRNFRGINRDLPIIFTALTYTAKAEDKIKREIDYMQGDKFIKDSFCGGLKLKTFDEFSKLLSHRNLNFLTNCFDSGYLGTGTSIAFQHVIPDNCVDILARILEPILRNPRANKAKINEYRKKLIFNPNFEKVA